jgi:hypothetical protein
MTTEKIIGKCLNCEKNVSEYENVISYTMTRKNIFCSVECEIPYTHKHSKIN